MMEETIVKYVMEQGVLAVAFFFVMWKMDNTLKSISANLQENNKVLAVVLERLGVSHNEQGNG